MRRMLESDNGENDVVNNDCNDCHEESWCVEKCTTGEK